ncbi:MAG: signal peptidase I [Bacilli bacterium]|nr:signal peptidase I [Bacilli bacterium]
MIVQNIKKNVHLIDPSLPFKEKVKYFCFFILRALLISIVIMFFGLILMTFIYFGDYFINVKSGNYKNPLFNAFIIVSNSMYPTLKINDGIFVHREDNLEVGDVITFDSINEDTYGMDITHRIVRKETLENGSIVYRTKGDNNELEDTAIVPFDNIFGKVILKITNLGSFRNFIIKPINMFLILLLPLLLIIVSIYFVSNKIKKINKEEIEII